MLIAFQNKKPASWLVLCKLLILFFFKEALHRMEHIGFLFEDIVSEVFMFDVFIRGH
jgi:hypothetical protein